MKRYFAYLTPLAETKNDHTIQVSLDIGLLTKCEAADVRKSAVEFFAQYEEASKVSLKIETITNKNRQQHAKAIENYKKVVISYKQFENIDFAHQFDEAQHKRREAAVKTLSFCENRANTIRSMRSPISTKRWTIKRAVFYVLCSISAIVWFIFQVVAPDLWKEHKPFILEYLRVFLDVYVQQFL